MRFYSQFGKRGLDFMLACAGVVFLCAPMLALALWIRLAEGAPVLFRQDRVGRKGVKFKIYKFRTMATRGDSGNSITVAGDDRVTKSGQWLRRFKLDELPQLLNVVKGDMSLVGPRPDVPGYMDRLEGEAARLLELRPGLTGPASLAFREEEALLASAANPRAFNDDVIFPEKVRLNLQYLDQLSLRTDLLCLWRTLLPSSGNRGAYQYDSIASVPCRGGLRADSSVISAGDRPASQRG